MLQSLFVLQVGIALLCIVIHTRGEQSRVFVTNERYEWFEAKDKCRLLTNERNFSSGTTRLGWTNFSAKYLPWVEYLGCFKFWEGVRLNGHEKRVKEGEQLQECIIHCNSSQLFGLQESTCICLPNSSLADGSVEKPCKTNVATCSGDSFAFCGKVGSGRFFSVYRKLNIGYRYTKDTMGNCLEFDNTHRNFKAENCSTKLYPMCFNMYSDVHTMFNTGRNTQSNWRHAYKNCQSDTLASFSTVIAKINKIKFTDKFWLSNTRRWTPIIDVEGFPEFCVAARIKQNGEIERIIKKCREGLPGLCIEGQQTSSDAPSKKSSTLSLVTTFSRRFARTSPSLRSNTFQGLTKYSASSRSTFLSRFVSTSSARKENTGRSKVVQRTTSPSQDFKETTSAVLVESSSSDLLIKDGVSVIVIIAIIAGTILIVIFILVTVVVCRRKRNTKVPTSNESLAMVGKEVVYAQVNKPTVKREKSTSSQKSQLTASDDTYDHMDHCRLSQTHNPTESNYDTMRAIVNAGEEENNYDHVTGTKIEPKRFVVDSATHYSHVEVEFHEVKDI